VVPLKLEKEEYRILTLRGVQCIEYVVVEHDARASKEIQPGGVMLPSGRCNLHNFGVHHRLVKLLVCITRDFQHSIYAAARAGPHASLPERPVAPIACTHAGELGWHWRNGWRGLDPNHRLEGGEVVKVAVDDVVRALRGLAWRPQHKAIVAQHIDGQPKP